MTYIYNFIFYFFERVGNIQTVSGSFIKMGKENLRFYLGEIDEVSGEIVHWIGEIGFSLLQQNILL